MVKNGIWKNKSVEFYEGRVVFKYKEKLSEEVLKNIFKGKNVIRFETLIEENNLYLVEFEDGRKQDTLSVCNELNAAVGVVWAEPDFVMRPLSSMIKNHQSPEDPEPYKKWHINKTGIPIAWEVLKKKSNESVVIAVLDSGIPLREEGGKKILTHPDLMSDRIVLEQNYEKPGGSLNDDIGHGTHVAGILCATENSAVGVVGINGTSPVHIYKVFEKGGGGFSSAIMSAYDIMRKARAYKKNVVINYSGGGRGGEAALKEMCQYIDDFNKRNVGKSQAIFCAAAGNGDANQKALTPPRYPANYAEEFSDSIVCVGSCDKNNRWSTFSDYGNSVTVVAPGENIYSTWTNPLYKLDSGTSMAAPVVSGIISLIWSYDGSLKSSEVIGLLKKYAVKPIDGKDFDQKYGNGVVTALWDDSYFSVNMEVGENKGSEDYYQAQLEFNIIN